MAQIWDVIDYDRKAWLEIIESEELLASFADGVVAKETSKRSPYEYNDDNPAKLYLKMIGFHVIRRYPDKFFISGKSLNATAANFRVAMALVDFVKKEKL